MLDCFIYKEPSSAYLRSLFALGVVGQVWTAILEVAGKNMQYAKFWNNSQQLFSIPSKIGMLIFYTPALLVAISSFLLFPDQGNIRFLLVKSALTLHFLKRDLEVLFIHKFSGSMVLETVIKVSGGYFAVTVGVVYSQHVNQEVPDPSVDIKYLGLFIFLVGIFGNFYHHYLLARLRAKGEKGYKIPRDGLFDLIVSPHYLFEIFIFIGISFISQTLIAYLNALGVVVYLSARSHSTRKWYLSKFEDFPKNVKALIPHVF